MNRPRTETVIMRPDSVTRATWIFMNPATKLYISEHERRHAYYRKQSLSSHDAPSQLALDLTTLELTP